MKSRAYGRTPSRAVSRSQSTRRSMSLYGSRTANGAPAPWTTAVGGTAYGDNTSGQYADNIQYRAWGAVKQLNYKSNDNLLIKMEYDARLRVSEHSAYSATDGFVRKAAFEYFADSRPKAMDNQINDQFDRTFTYDSVGRLSANSFGNSQAGVPYMQTVSYDAFSNMTTRNTTHWGMPNNFNASYTNGRKQPSGTVIPVYDAAGNMVNPGSKSTGESYSTTFDAANRSSEFKTIYRRRVGQYSTARFEKSITQTYDGDGHPVKDTESNRRMDMSPPETPITTTKYQIWSSVFNSALTEVKQDGTKERTKVFAGAAVIAEQNQTSYPSPTVEYIAADPVTGSSVKRLKHSSVYYYGRTELEALGQEVLETEPVSELPDSAVRSDSIITADQPEWMCSNAVSGHLSFWEKPVHCQIAIIESGRFSIPGILADRGSQPGNPRAIELTGKVLNKHTQQQNPWLNSTFKPTGGGLAAGGFPGISGSLISALSGIGNQQVLATVQSLPYKEDLWESHFSAENSGVQNGFKIGRNGVEFSPGEAEDLRRIWGLIQESKTCKRFIQKKLDELNAFFILEGRGAKKYGSADALINAVVLQRYDYNLTEQQIGDTGDYQGMRDKADLYRAGSADIFRGAVIPGNVNIWLSNAAFRKKVEYGRGFLGTSLNAPAFLPTDLLGTIVHELFHVLGVKDPIVAGMNKQIKENCSSSSNGKIGEDY